ncbi:MAG TPA: branched-chain amino acid dehydrogenase [Candidatus Cloacimonas sp.]|jgi:3-oxoacid CoA-transferase A subunit|nr:acetate CoA/acetoacetate CoA-transferase alpha subunit [Candidatus Cloacimonadota bacterium]HCX72255.1 branched-chain amino acid dehydrogenase [Candidatus Cloacimonas sp.]
MPQIISAPQAAALIKPHDRIMFGSFLAAGAACSLIDALMEAGTQNLHMITIATDYDDRGVGKLISNKQIKSLQCSHIGTNKSTQAQMNAGEIEIELIPQGTLAERIRAAGAGLGGILTPTGVDTVVEDGKQKFEFDGKAYILERPIKADFAFIRAKKADKLGNLVYYKTARNSNPAMAMAAKTTIVEVDEIVEIGQIDPENVITPGIFVDYLVKREV